MDFPEGFSIFSIVPTLLSAFFGAIVLFVAHFFLIRRKEQFNIGSPLMRQLSMLALSLSVVLVIVLSLPLGDSTRGQILSFLGIVVTAAIALSSTTFLGNIMAGLMIKAIGSIRPGDFIRIEENFGRVSELGLLHTEIQNEDRDLTTLPNLYLVTNPVKVVRSSGTIISATITLGYDVPYSQVVDALEKAALNADLEDPYVQILELGDYSISYRVAGFLKEVKTLISARSRLRVASLHCLHQADIEIVSPSFMNQRRISETEKVIPVKIEKTDNLDDEDAPEDLIFDKADQAESLEKIKERLKEQVEALKKMKEEMAAIEDENERQTRQTELDRCQNRCNYLEKLIESKKNQ